MEGTIKIQALDSMVGNDFVYGKGGIYDVPEDRAKDLIKAGLAIAVSPAKQGKETATPKIQYETRKK